MKRVSYVVANILLIITLIAIRYPTSAQTTPNDPLNNLAQRFRPYLKFSIDGGSDEQIRPCPWEWLVQRSELYRVPKTGW